MRTLFLKSFLFSLVLTSFFCSYSQSRTVKGKVKDANDNTTLPGVTVFVKGTTNGSTTDLDGNYSVQIPEQATLIFSYIGYKTVEINVGSQTMIDIALESDLTELSEVVVVGYGTLNKREITGSITKIGGDELKKIPTPSFEAALQGKISGVQVIQGSGLAGSGSVIRIRGISSISAGGDPLYVVDGIPIVQDQFTNVTRNSGAMNTNPLATINPNDIASVEVLKDAAAAGIYGTRGANGVILITTKRGSGTGDSFNFSTKLGISNPVAKPRMLNTSQYLQLYQEAWENDGKVGRATLPSGMTWDEVERRNIDTDWWDLMTQTGFKQDYNLSWNKGGKKLKTYSGISYSDNQSYMVNNAYERISGRLNLDYQLSSQTKISLLSSYSRGNNSRVNTAWSGGLGDAMSTALPIYPVLNDDGSFWSIGANPVRQAEFTKWNLLDTRILNSLKINQKITNQLSLDASGSYDYFKSDDQKWDDGQIDPSTDFIGTAYANTTWVKNWNLSTTLNYNTTISGNSLKILVGSEYQQSTRDFLTGVRKSDVSEQIRFNPATTEKSEIAAGTRSEGEETKFFSVFARFNYNIKNKYFFQGTYRIDASSKFAEEFKSGVFPTIGVSWFANEEEFLKGSSIISLLKLKANFGITGNSNLPQNEYIGTYKRLSPPDNGYALQPILFPTKFPNPGLKWETTNAYDAGIEAGFFNDRIIVEFDYYYKLTNDVLMELALPPQNGIDLAYWANVGQIENKGIDIALNTENIKTQSFSWTTNLNISKNANKIKSIGKFSEEAVSGGTNDTRVIVGQPVGTNFLVRFSHVDPANGRPVYLDIDGVETYDWDPKDRVATGSVLPDFVGGITNTFSYKSWNFSFLFAFSKGGNIYDSSSKRQLGVVTEWNMREDLFDRWRQPGDIAKYPRLTMDTETYGSPTPWINTDLWVHDASYIRLRSVNLSYQIDSPIDMIKNISVSFSAFNLLTFTKFVGLDPEIARDFENATDRNMSSNITYLTPPQEKSFSLGLNFNF
jgi:TonB-dependent starch-binding outer membrane protein SusC